ncbi:unnamed protein product [Symbiodinium sp. CCMP2592]|nr:unnamed protein product [Symbiodinium sp. CCMP2592]
MIEQRNEERLEMIEEKMDKMTEARSLNGQGSESVGPVSPVRPGFRSETQSLFQGCARREVARQVAKERKHSARTRAIARAVQQTCGPDYLVLIKYPADATRVERTCCLRSSTACAGCAKSADERTCEECAGGFIKRGSTCVSCADSAGWASLDGSTCAQLQGSGCNAQKVRGQSSNEACCHCGGGHLTPTPFSYDVKQWVLGSDVRLAPLPRTADRYSLDEGCELAAHNLTLDASTGIVSVAADRLPPAEVFDLECTVTAHQSGAEAYSTVLRISMTDFTYGAPLLWFPSEVSESYAPIPPITTTTTTTTTTATTTTATTTTTKAPKPFILTTSQVQVQNGAGHTYQLEDQVVTVTFKHDVVLGPSTSSRVRARMPQDVELEPHMARTDFYTYDGAAQYKPGFICRWDSGNNNVIWFKWDQFGSNVWIHTSVTVTIPAGTTCQYPAGSNAQVVLQQRQPDEVGR